MITKAPPSPPPLDERSVCTRVLEGLGPFSFFFFFLPSFTKSLGYKNSRKSPLSSWYEQHRGDLGPLFLSPPPPLLRAIDHLFPPPPLPFLSGPESGEKKNCFFFFFLSCQKPRAGVSFFPFSFFRHDFLASGCPIEKKKEEDFEKKEKKVSLFFSFFFFPPSFSLSIKKRKV